MFATLDANSPYWYIEIEEADMEKTSYTSRHGLHKFLRISFGLRNAPAKFQRAMDILLCLVKLHTAVVFLYNIGKFSRTVKQHMEHVSRVDTLLYDEQLTMKLKKWTFSQKFNYSYHLAGSGHLEFTVTAAKAIQKFEWSYTWDWTMFLSCTL